MKSCIFVFLLLAACFVSAQQYHSLGNDPQRPMYTVLSSDANETIIRFDFQGFTLSPVQTSQGVKYQVIMEGASPMLNAGDPALLRVSKSLIIPDLGAVKAEIVESEYIDFPNVDIVPSKGNLTRDIDPSTVPYTWGRTYQQGGVFPASQTSLSDPYILRDYRGVTLNVFPFQFDAANNTLRAVRSIIIKVSADPAGNAVNEFQRNTQVTKVQEDFRQLYERHFVNYNQAKYTSVAERGNILVISYAGYMDAMAPWVQWKKRIGFPTTIVDVATIGTTATAIKTYVTNYYNTNGLTFLLLVGDGQHIPPVTSGVGGPSDNAYAFITGSDHYPEFYVGRFSAESTADVDVQVLRTITYEQSPSTTNNWMNRVMGIASDQGPGDDSEYDYQHIRNLQTQCVGYEYVTKYEIFDGSQGGLDASGNPTATNVSSVLNGDGAGLILYTGHGGDQSFVTTGFSNSDVNALTNTTRWPFIFAVACVNGNFQGQTCFAEAWLRARTGTTPKGAVATIMSTINQSWNPPMEGQDEMVNVLTENNASNIKHTFGGVVMSGCMKMNDSYGTAGNEMTDTWTIFGDPSLLLRTDTPNIMTVTHAASIPVGSTSLVVNCNANDAFVTVTLDDNILGTGTVSGGTVTISFPALSTVDTLLVTATKYNYIPYMGEVAVIAATGPYVVYSTYSVSDGAGNSNGEADFSENIQLNVTLHNMGVANASNVVATLSSSDPAVVISDNSETYGAINAGATKLMNNAYAVSVGSAVDDQHVVNFGLAIVDGGNSWSSTFGMPVNAPALAIGNVSIDDATGNNNGRLDPGETVTLTIESFNNGHAAYPAATGAITTGSSYLTVISGTANIGNMAIASSANPTFTVSVDAATPLGASVSFTYELGSGYYQVEEVFSLKVGIADEDYESGDFTQYSWTTGGTQPWVVSTETPYEGTYCSKSGTITDNQTSTMSITWDVASPDSISFYRKVDCEEGSASGSKWDYLQFKVGSVEKDWWDGTKGWERVSYAVSAGPQTYTWAYVKDGYVSEGADAAWVDYIVFPPIATIAGCSENELSGVSIYPNPSFGTFSIDMVLKSSGEVTIEQINSAGQLVEVLYHGDLDAGNQKIMVSGHQITGAFFIRISTPDGEQTRMIWSAR